MAKVATTKKAGKGKLRGAKAARAKTSTARRRPAGKKTTVKKRVGKKSPGGSRASASAKKKKAKVAKKKTARKVASRKKAKLAASAKTAGKKTVAKNTVAKKTVAKKTTAKKTAAKNAAVTAGKKTIPKAGRAAAGAPTSKLWAAKSAVHSSATAQDPIQFPELDRRVPKTHLKAKELREYRTLLRNKRAELAGDVQHLSTEVSNRSSDGSGGDHSAMPIHMADLGTDNWEKEFTMGLIANERDRIRDIDEALERIDAKTYGTCLATHRPISTARLRAKPWAKYCIDFARAREEGRA